MSASALEHEYANATRRARRLVASHYPLEVLEDAPPGTAGWREVWRVVAGNPSAPLPLRVAIPYTFPDLLPSVFPEGANLDQNARIPHLDSRGLLCTFDTNEVVTNPDAHPGDIVLAVVERALTLWQDGMEGVNHQDFSDEFEAYWALESVNHVLALVPADSQLRTMQAWHLQPHWKGHTWLVAPTQADGRCWLTNIGYRVSGTPTPVLYLPLARLGMPPYPATNRELFNRLKQHDPRALHRLLAFLGRQRRPAGILFSVPAGPARAMGMWWHPAILDAPSRILSHRRRASGSIRGFRPGPRAAQMELLAHHGDEQLIRGTITRVDPDRLLGRTAGSIEPRAAQPVNIVGCGSIGSLLAEQLARSGVVSGLRLIDPETLTVENVLRHLCGMADVGQPKVGAVARQLATRFPHLGIEQQAHNVLDLLRTTPDALVPAALTVVAIGDYAAERRINRLARSGVLPTTTPLCFVWVEPHLAGGHAVLVHPTQPGCLECLFDDRLLFSHRVIADPQGLTRREAGCQTTYMPYSGVDAVTFVAALGRFLCAAATIPENTVFSWVGDRDQVQRGGRAVQPQWEGSRPFTTRQVPLVARAECPGCAAA